ncbi:hypothetical protein BDV95DRAFT_580566 [Massariosphaeria phaeospora]|uniref:Uncharacterized protein n=1 Tax=Massariosphaeria phaeospora TaxID=100035 RepID=A0A7C8I675_9PLEO|nr:hypothetical protein BDV95DRAFT_580566 [Massariosphaeria phaeospora]
MVFTLDTGLIRRSSAKETSVYFRTVLSQHPEAVVTNELLLAVEQGSLAPPALAVWLGTSKSPGTIARVLKQGFSVEGRRLGIRHFKNQFRSSKWKELWHELGETAGMLAIFSAFSVREVRGVCRVLSCSSTGEDQDGKRKAITSLLKALLPRLFSAAASPNRTTDQRPLIKHYESLVPGCTPEFISQMVNRSSDGDWKHIRTHLLAQNHADTLRDFALKYVFTGHPTPQQAHIHARYSRLSDFTRQFPATTAAEKGFSASMEFSLQVLRKLANDEDIPAVTRHDFLDNLIQPLLKRAVRKKAEWSRTQEIVDLTVRFLHRYPEVKAQFPLRRGGVLHLVALCWSRRPELFENLFKALLAQQREQNDQAVDITRFETLLLGVAKPRRYPLLRLCTLEVAKQDLDGDIDGKLCRGTLTSTLLNKLGTAQALHLFASFRRGMGDEELVQCGPWSSVTSKTYTFGDHHYGDPDLYHITLLQRNGQQQEAEELSMKCVHSGMKKTMSISDRSQRAFYATKTVYYGISSGSLEIFKEVLEWAKRFVRDPLTAQAIHQHWPEETHAVLSGIPAVLNTQLSNAATLYNRILQGNQILRSLFETVCLALREPAFALHNWQGTLYLFYHAVRERLRRSSELQTALALSDDEVYHILWEDTVKMLVEVEEKALEYEKGLQAHTVRGILGYQDYVTGLHHLIAPNYRFVDELARARDGLWRRYRPTLFPEAAVLDEAYPRGLPIQHLLHPFCGIDIPQLDTYTPYIAERVRKTLFPTAEVASTPFSQDSDKWFGIGRFIDDYSFALRLYLPERLDEDERQQRVQKAWAYAVGPLSEGVMRPDEAIRYWRTVEEFKCCAPAQEPQDWPLVPVVDDADQIEEWSPSSPRKRTIKSRALSAFRYIDISKKMDDMKRSDETAYGVIRDIKIEIPGEDQETEPIWSWTRTARARGRPAMREGQIFSALLYLNTQTSGPGLLKTPFPSKADVRYPPVYFDDRFVVGGDQDANKSAEEAFTALNAHLKYVPPALLSKLASNLLDNFKTVREDGGRYHIVESLTFRLVGLLTRSDRPGLASTLAVKAIIENPDASSWHRRLLHSGFFRRLPAADARACIDQLGNAIITKLEEQARDKEARAAKAQEAEKTDIQEKNEEVASLKPLVKITTVKFLAQLLRDTEFVPEDYSVAVLSKLLQKVSHPDARLAVISSLLNLLQSAPPELSEKILEELEIAVPIASNINERQPLSEADWTKAERELEMPEICFVPIDTASSPLLQSLIRFLAYQSRDYAYRGAFIKRILLPIIERLKEQTTRWTTLFLRKHGIDEATQRGLNIPPVPLSWIVWNRPLMDAPQHVSTSLLEDYVSYIIFAIAPPAPIKALNKKLAATRTLRSQPAVKIWLSLYGEGLEDVDNAVNLPTRMCTLIDKVAEANDVAPGQTDDDATRITVKFVQEQYLKIFTAVVWHDDAHFYYVNALMSQLRPSGFNNAWLTRRQPLVEAVIQYISSLRTRDWERDPARQPKVLPDTFPLQLWLLKYPDRTDVQNAAGDAESKCKRLADEIASLLAAMPGTLYHSKLAALKNAVHSFVTSKTDRPRVALHLGDVSSARVALSWLTVQDLLRVEVAALILAESYAPEDEEVKRRVRELLQSWRMSGSEGVRRWGATVRWKDTAEEDSAELVWGSDEEMSEDDEDSDSDEDMHG